MLLYEEMFACWGEPETPPETPPELESKDESIDGFTPEQQKVFNTAMKKEKEKYRKQTEQQLQQLESLKKSKSLSEEESKGLSEQIDSLKKSLMTKEELAKEEKLKLQHQHKTELEKVTQERDRWQKLHTDSIVDRSLLDAASDNEAVDPNQILLIVRPSTTLEVDPETKELVPKVQLKDQDAEGNPVTLSLTPSEAVKRMKEKEKNWNLFKTSAKGGMGGTNASTSMRDLDASKIAEAIRKDPEWYMKNRDKVMQKLS